MRTLMRNKVGFYYSLYQGKQPSVDEYGNTTGEYEIFYEKPAKSFANISSARGETQTRQFGESESYDKVIVMDNTSPNIDEHSVLWVDTEPVLDDNGDLARNDKDEIISPYDYVVKKIARSLNSISIAIEKVVVS